MPKKKSSKSSTSDGKMRICFERIVPPEYAPARFASEQAVVSNFMRMAAPSGLDASGVIHPQRAAMVMLKKWENGRTLSCRFLDGSAKQKSRVEAKAHIWEKYANIKIKFVTSASVDIRISFKFDSGSWSAVGNDCLVEKYFPKYQPTMNYGWLEDNTDDQEYERVVVHEFGHALGLVHEHQSPKAKLKWNKTEVYRVFSGPPNFWSKADIDSNILEKYSPKGIKDTPFDNESIMLYQFDGKLFTDGKGTPNNTRLSDRDKAFITQMYPKG
jgi:hypothetical protein